MYPNLLELDIYDLCKVRDALIILNKYSMADEDLLYEVQEEIKKRGEK